MKYLILLALVLGPVFSPAQSAQDMADEPHHHLVLKNDQLRVFAVTLEPSEQAFVKHDHNFLVVSLQDCEIVMWSNGQSPIQSFRFGKGDTRFSFAGRDIGLRNDQTTEYRNITVEFLNPKVTSIGIQPETGSWGYVAAGINSPADPHAKFVSQINLQAAAATEAQLLPGDSFPAPEKPANELLIPITDLDLKNPEGTHIRKAIGETLWMGEGRKAALENYGTDPAQFVMVQLWMQPSA